MRDTEQIGDPTWQDIHDRDAAAPSSPRPAASNRIHKEDGMANESSIHALKRALAEAEEEGDTERATLIERLLDVVVDLVDEEPAGLGILCRCVSCYDDVAKPAQPTLSPAERIRRWAGWPECLPMPAFDATKHINVWFEEVSYAGHQMPNLHRLIRDRGLEEPFARALATVVLMSGPRTRADFTGGPAVSLADLTLGRAAMATAEQRAKALLRVIEDGGEEGEHDETA